MTIKNTIVSDEEAQTVRELTGGGGGGPEPLEQQGGGADPTFISKPTKKNAATDDNLEGGDVQYPPYFYCPLTKQIMTDPVVHPDGDSYEREAIMSRQNDDSLLTFYPNRALKAYIERETERIEEAGSVRGTIQTLQTNIRTGWDKFVEQTALPLGEPARPLPDEFYCTLTLDLCHEPVIDPDGFTYEREAIVHWVNNNGDSPVTRKSLAVDQLYDNNAILNILLTESEKPDDAIHPCIRRWKEELSSPPPSIVPETTSSMDPPSGSRAVIPMNIIHSSSGGSRHSSSHLQAGDGTSSSAHQYPTTHEEMEERMAREHRKSMITLLIVIVIISFALVYLPFYLVVFALAFCSCLYARRRFHERRRYGR